MRPANTIVIASNNRHKLQEFKSLFQGLLTVELHPASDYLRNSEKLGLVETSDHYYDNAVAKARACNQGCHYPSLSDDSGLEVDHLNGAPGVQSHRYALPKSGETQDSANVKKLLKALEGVPFEKRTARFVCHLALVMEGTLLHVAGTLEGTIAEAPRGENGFGYDPVFIPRGFQQTLSELGEKKKNEISHRALAVKALVEEIRQREINFVRP